MTFEHWWALLAIPPAVWAIRWLGGRGSRLVPPRQHRWSVLARSLAIALLIAAIGQPLLVRAVDDRTVFFLLDRSDSISAETRELQEQVLDSALSQARSTDRVGVGVFGVGLEVDTALTIGLEDVEVLAEVDGSATDLGGALAATASVLPSEGSRRIVVLSDLVETSGDARAAARELERAGIAVDIVQLPGSRPPDAIVEAIRLPATVRTGETVTARISVRSNQAGNATVVVESEGGETREIPVELEVGAQVIEVPVDVVDPGALRVAARIEAGFDTRPENDAAVGITRVLGPAQVAVVEGVAGEASNLIAALEAGGLVVDEHLRVPSDGELLEYDAVVLVNVGRPDEDTSERLVGYVEDLGRGLLVIGGDRSFGLGDYHQTPLEAILPVSSNPDDLVRRQPVAEVLVIDSSGSMGRCHCNNGISSEAGPVKTDIAKAGAGLAIDALSDSDTVGVLTFSSGYDWVIPLGLKPDAATVEEALGQITPDGDTEIATALEQALEEVRSVPDALRHIVLFTDGWDPNDANLVPIARRIADAGVTLSVLGTGEGPGTTLRRMADVGGGRFYPGTDLESVPEVFVEETLTVARNLATEGSFFPALRVPSEATRGITSTPPLLGYVLTKPKATAAVNLEIGQGDPLLASWQRGLGRVTAWTSDATTRWSAGWVDWDGFVSFWGATLREVLPAGRERPPEVFVEEGSVKVTASAEGLGDGASATMLVRSPDGSTVAVPMVRTAADTFAAEANAVMAGAYWAAVTIDDGEGGTVTSGSGAVSSYEEEFAFREPDPSLARDVAGITGGRVDPEVAAMFDPAPALGRVEQPIWPWLVTVALALFLLDVALRRLVLAAGDAEAWRRGMTSERAREQKRVEEIEAGRAATPEEKPSTASDSATLERLMRRKR